MDRPAVLILVEFYDLVRGIAWASEENMPSMVTDPAKAAGILDD